MYSNWTQSTVSYTICLWRDKIRKSFKCQFQIACFWKSAFQIMTSVWARTHNEGAYYQQQENCFDTVFPHCKSLRFFVFSMAARFQTCLLTQCEEKQENVAQIISSCKMLTQRDYKERRVHVCCWSMSSLFLGKINQKKLFSPTIDLWKVNRKFP